MRFVVCFLGLLASSLMAGVGVIFLLGDVSLEWAFENGQRDLLNLAYITENTTHSLTGVSLANGALVIFVAAAYGFLASFLVLLRCGKQAALLFLVTALGAGLAQPVSLIAGLPYLFVFVLALFVGPLPLNAPSQADDDEEDEKPKAKPKAMPKPAALEDEDEEEEEMPKPKARAMPKPAPLEDEDEEEEMPKPKPKAKAKPKKAADEDDE